MIFVNVHFVIKPECRESFLKCVGDKLPSIHKEQGCIEYSLQENVFERNHFMIYEKWESSEDLELHHQQSYFKPFLVEVMGYSEGKPIIDKIEKI